MAVELLNIDCMELLATLPNKAFDLAIVDPPYGINVGNMAFLTEKKNKKRGYKKSDLDKNIPTEKYFEELFRVSKNQIIWGIDYFNLNIHCKGRIKWDKGMPEGVSFKRYETAYCSLINNEIEIKLLWAGMQQAYRLSAPMLQQGNKRLNEKRIHPTQKPILLYSKLLLDYAKKGYKILDTHLGSGSSAIAAYRMGCDFVGCELDEDYYNAAVKRFKEQTAQLKLL